MIGPSPKPSPRCGEGLFLALPLREGRGEGITIWRARRNLPWPFTIHRAYVAGKRRPHPPTSRYRSFQPALAAGGEFDVLGADGDETDERLLVVELDLDEAYGGWFLGAPETAGVDGFAAHVIEVPQ